MAAEVKPARGHSHRGWKLYRQMLYEDVYFWLVLLSALDVFLTWLILSLGGELDQMASLFAAGGLRMLVVYKLFIIVLVVVICEEIGRRRPATGRRVADLAVVVTCLPVILGLLQLFLVF